MKKLFLIPALILSIVLTSCSSDDDSGDSGSQTANIKVEIITSRNTSAIVTRTLNNDTQTNDIENLPYSFTYAQQNVSTGTFVKLTFLEDGDYSSSTGGGNSWTDYTAELKISVDNNTVSTQNFSVNQSNSGEIKQIDYTF